MATSSSSSAKKVAKLAQRGKGKKVRFQGGTLFPAVVAGVLVVGLALIVFARQTVPDPGSYPPQYGDHWHVAYGMYVCDGWLPVLTGAKEETVTDAQGNQSLANAKFAATGIHSHGDGVIHWHPSQSSKAIGKNATFGVFLDVYDVKLSTDELQLPKDQGGDDYKTDDYQCNGKDVEIKVVAWDSYADTGKGTTYITNLDDVRVKQDGMVFVIAVVPAGTDVAMPPWAKELPELGASDGGATTTTTPTGDTTGGSTPDTTADTTATTTATSDTTATTGG